MKKILTIALLLFSIATFAQGNLQFNQVLTFSGTLSSTQSQGTIYTVPANKVWKIKYLTEKIAYTGAQNSLNIGLYRGLMACINSKWITNSSLLKETFLKAGDSLKLGYYDEYNPSSQLSDNTIKLDYLISIVEFNIIP